MFTYFQVQCGCTILADGRGDIDWDDCRGQTENSGFVPRPKVITLMFLSYLTHHPPLSLVISQCHYVSGEYLYIRQFCVISDLGLLPLIGSATGHATAAEDSITAGIHGCEL